MTHRLMEIGCALCSVDVDLERCQDCDEILCAACADENACPFEPDEEEAHGSTAERNSKSRRSPK